MPNSFSTTKSDPNGDLYRQAERLGHRVVWYRFRNAPCLTIEDGDGSFAIGIDPAQLRSRADERVKLAHELGHCETGTLYPIDVTPSARRRREERADRWAIRRLMPCSEVISALESGLDTAEALAERFGVTEDFARQALSYYRDVKGRLR